MQGINKVSKLGEGNKCLYNFVVLNVEVKIFKFIFPFYTFN